jgi:IclR family transcriptional regulator, acetate operon repressor
MMGVTTSREPVGRALDVLAWMADHHSEPLGVRQIARDLDTSPSTIHRILTTFQDRHLVARGDNGEYVAGLELYRICAVIAGEMSLARIAHSRLQQLTSESRETTLFGTYDSSRGQMMFIDRVEALHPLRYVVDLHQWLPVHAGATGLAILAFLPEEERQRIYAAGLDALTPGTLVSVPDLEKELAEIRRRGYAWSMNQRVQGAVGFAAPVFDSTGAVCGDMCITLPEQRFEAGTFADSLAATLMTAADQVTADLKAMSYRAAAYISTG